MLKLTWEKITAQKLPLFLIIFFLTFTPLLAYLVSVRFQTQDFLNLQKLVQQTNSVSQPNISALDQLRKNLEEKFNNSPQNSQNTPSNGPTLRFQLAIEGRTNDQSTRLFVGIAPGSITNNPSFVLSFLVDIPASGVGSGLPITGLDIGSTYTAYLKGSAQLTKGVTFTYQPLNNDLGTVNLISGDLNEDNQINSADLEIERKLVGKTPSSPDWNKDADFDQDGVINNIDLTYISKNLGKVGDSGPWVSSPLNQAKTLGISTNSGRPDITKESTPSSSGYWLWIPRF